MSQEKRSAIDLIADERRRQIEDEGFDTKHDDEHDDAALAWAAACYAAPDCIYTEERRAGAIYFTDPFPSGWGDKRCEPKQSNYPTPRLLKGAKRLDVLVKAGALIVAEIERLQRRSSS